MNLFTSAEAAQYLKVSQRTLSRYRRDGLIDYTQVKRKISFTQADLDRYIARFKRPAYCIPDLPESIRSFSNTSNARKSWK
jgi:excisionase family DNA binding protein